MRCLFGCLMWDVRFGCKVQAQEGVFHKYYAQQIEYLLKMYYLKYLQFKKGILLSTILFTPYIEILLSLTSFFDIFLGLTKIKFLWV